MRCFVVGLTLLAWATPAAAQEQVARSKVVSAGLFKNGLAVIKREIDLPGPGTYRLEDLPEPVHGTWWVESTAVVETSTKTREVDVPVRGDPNLQQDLAGKKVTVYFKGGRPEPVNGVVVKMPAPKAASEPDTPPVMDRWGRMVYGTDGRAAEAPSRFLVLKTAKGRMFIDSAEISIVEAEGADDVPTRKERKPVLLVAAKKAAKDKLYVTYLTHGLAWAPSYRVDISDPKTLAVELAAVVKNELTNLDGAELRLISGFPSVQFAHVRSPLSPHQTWAAFFQELTTPTSGRGHALMTQAVVANVVSPNQPFGLDMKATPMGEGVDLHFQSIGKRTLGKGEALSLSIAKDKAAYERIVEWIIPDNRDADGRVRAAEPTDDDGAWDALRFKNPFTFPMTTGPAMVTANGQFNGQRTSYFVNAGEETSLRITKALSVRTRHGEQEIAGKNTDREFLWVGGHRYMQSTLEGEVLLANHRKEDIKVVVRRRFSGTLLSAEGDPRTTLREEGAYSVNRRNEMVWVLSLRGGEERRLTYRYNVLVAH
jgi:hypothetical protein